MALLSSPPVRRFISHDELARDRRFKRSSSRNELLRSLPDDVDQVVRVLERIAPKIRERVEGTALEAVFAAKAACDIAGHYSRPDVLRLQRVGVDDEEASTG